MGPGWRGVDHTLSTRRKTMTVNSASARYEGLGKDGKGHIWTARGALDGEPYGFASRFEDGPGTNPEELIAAAHAACFTMALSFGLARDRKSTRLNSSH